MKLARGMGKARKWLSGGLATMTPWRVGRVLAVGAMLAAGAALYFSMGLEEERGPSANSGITPASQAQVYTLPEDPELAEAPHDELSKNFIGIPATGNEFFQGAHAATVPEIWEDDPGERAYDELKTSFTGIPAAQKVLIIGTQNITEFFGEDVVATLGYEVLAAKLDQYQADGPLTSRDLERLDQEIDMLMIAAGEKSSEAQTSYNREIERLEEEEASLLSEARLDPTTDPSELDRELRRLDFQIDMLRLAALEQQ